MPSSAVRTFTDPDEYAVSVRADWSVTNSARGCGGELDRSLVLVDRLRHHSNIGMDPHNDLLNVGGGKGMPGRADDTYGIGCARTQFSSDFVPFLRQALNLGLNHEVAIETCQRRDRLGTARF